MSGCHQSLRKGKTFRLCLEDQVLPDRQTDKLHPTASTAGWLLHCSLPHGWATGVKAVTGLAFFAGHWLLKYMKLAARPEACKAFYCPVTLNCTLYTLYMCAATEEVGLRRMSGLKGFFLYQCVEDFGMLWRPKLILIPLKHCCQPCNHHSASLHLFPADQLLAA